ncbi:hypothetical protein V9K97_02230 [Variovorax sp. CCNWLW186]|uniref:hypothetical protein n=1 Tax=Variovorax sp. CCNWLW186 TaxID=3127473 RepID=UPI003077F8BC
MSEDIKRQALAHLNEQQAALDAREHAAKIAREAAAKKRQEALQKFLDLCASTIEPAMTEFRGYLDGQAITGSFHKDFEDRPYPRMSFFFTSQERRNLASVEFKYTGDGDVDVQTKQGPATSIGISMANKEVTKEAVQQTLLDVLKKLKL